MLCKVWSAIAYAGDAAISLPLLRLQDLTASTVPADKKLEEGQKAFDEYAVVAAEGRQAALKKMIPVCINRR